MFFFCCGFIGILKVKWLFVKRSKSFFWDLCIFIRFGLDNVLFKSVLVFGVNNWMGLGRKDCVVLLGFIFFIFLFFLFLVLCINVKREFLLCGECDWMLGMFLFICLFFVVNLIKLKCCLIVSCYIYNVNVNNIVIVLWILNKWLYYSWNLVILYFIVLKYFL